MDGDTQRQTFLLEITNLIENFSHLPAPKLSETLEFGYLRGRNGQIYVVSRAAYEAVKQAKTKTSKPPKIQFYLEQATSWSNQLRKNPDLTHTQLGMKFALSRSEVIHTLNLLKLPNQAKEFIRKIPWSASACPLTKKKLRKLCLVQEKEVQLDQFKNLALDLFRNNQEMVRLLNETLAEPNQPIEGRSDIEFIHTPPYENPMYTKETS